MIAQNKYWLFSAGLLCCSLAQAQDGRKLTDVPQQSQFVIDDVCRQCDSLGEVYLAAGDTLTAIYYFRQYLNAYPDHAIKQNNIIKLQHLYYNRRQSFYLEDQ